MSAKTVTDTLTSIILGMSQPPIPTAHLTSKASKGGLAVSWDTAAGFPMGGLLMFADDLGERPVKMTAVRPEGATLATAGDGRTGLDYDHAPGVLAYANLFGGRTILDGPLIANGSLVLCVIPKTWDSIQITIPKGYETVWTIELMLIMRLSPGQGTTIDQNLWGLEQQARAVATFEALTLAIKGGLPIQQENGYNLALGMSGQAVPHFHGDMSQLTGDVDVMEFQAALDIVLREREPTPAMTYNGFL